MFDDIFCRLDVGGKYVHAHTFHQHTNDIKCRWLQCAIGFLLKWPDGPTLCRTTEYNNTYINALHIFISIAFRAEHTFILLCFSQINITFSVDPKCAIINIIQDYD